MSSLDVLQTQYAQSKTHHLTAVPPEFFTVGIGTTVYPDVQNRELFCFLSEWKFKEFHLFHNQIKYRKNEKKNSLVNVQFSDSQWEQLVYFLSFFVCSFVCLLLYIYTLYKLVSCNILWDFAISFSCLRKHFSLFDIWIVYIQHLASILWNSCLGFLFLCYK